MKLLAFPMSNVLQAGGAVPRGPRVAALHTHTEKYVQEVAGISQRSQSFP